MNKLLKFLLILFYGLLCGTANAVIYSKPVGFINDFANIIPNKQEKQMESFLRNYEKKTSVEIAVVTTNSLNRLSIEQWSIGLATRWGIGKKNKDNGILIVIAPIEKKYRIEVGYGLEWIITDGIAGSLGRKILVPAFKRQNYAGGIDNLIRVIVKKIGQQSAQERTQLHSLQKQIHRKHIKDGGYFLLSLLCIAILLGIFIFVFKMAVDFFADLKRKKLLIKKIRNRITIANNNFDKIIDKTEKFEQNLSKLPKWAQEEVKTYLRNIRCKKRDLVEKIAEVDSVIHNNPDRVNSNMNIISIVSKAQDDIDSIGSVFRKIYVWHEELKELMPQIEVDIKTLSSQVNDAISDGIIIKSSIDLQKHAHALKLLKKRIKSNSIGDNDDISLIHQEAVNLKAAIAKDLSFINKIIEDKVIIENYVKEYSQKYSDLEKQLINIEYILVDIMKEYPNTVWFDINSRYEQVVEDFKRFPQLIEAVEKMIQQNRFARGVKIVNEISVITDEINFISNEMNSLKINLFQAKQDYTKLFNLVNVAINKAELIAKGNDSRDIDSSTTQILQTALEKRNRVTTLANAKKVNWLEANALLREVMTLVAKFTRVAEEDIAQAKRHRRRRHNFNNTSALGYSSFGSSSSGSSFGGFGGGGFGGGGASGSW